MADGFQLIGDKALKRKLMNLAVNTQRKVARHAVTKAATPIVRSAKSKVPRESGTLAKSLTKKVKTYRDTMTVVAIVGPSNQTKNTYKGKVRMPKFYAHLVHGGFVMTNGQHVPGTPFLANAMEETQGQALETLKSQMAAGIIREASK